MASIKAISAVTRGIVNLLKSSFEPALFDGANLEFEVYDAGDFKSPMAQGVSLFLYRIYHNGTNRRPAGPMGNDGRRQRPRLPLDLHFILTAWAPAPSLQHAIAGWMMRVVEDHPVLPAGFLNFGEANAFSSDEIVEVSPIELSNDELLRLWEGLVQNVYHLSIPYVARTVLIESLVTDTSRDPVTDRQIDFHAVAGGGGSA